MGLIRVADLLRLPRRGLRERLGSRRMDWLGRLLGESPDPRPAFVPPAVHRARLELPGEIELAASLVFPCQRLLLELEGVLVGREAGTRRLDWRLAHPDRPDTGFQLGSARPRWRAQDWLMLLHGILERLELPAPVREVALCVEDMITLDPRAADLSPGLFPDLPGADAAPDPTCSTDCAPVWGALPYGGSPWRRIIAPSGHRAGASRGSTPPASPGSIVPCGCCPSRGPSPSATAALGWMDPWI
jgi:protein ImuB